MRITMACRNYKRLPLPESYNKTDNENRKCTKNTHDGGQAMHEELRDIQMNKPENFWQDLIPEVQISASKG